MLTITWAKQLSRFYWVRKKNVSIFFHFSNIIFYIKENHIVFIFKFIKNFTMLHQRQFHSLPSRLLESFCLLRWCIIVFRSCLPLYNQKKGNGRRRIQLNENTETDSVHLNSFIVTFLFSVLFHWKFEKSAIECKLIMNFVKVECLWNSLKFCFK